MVQEYLRKENVALSDNLWIIQLQLMLNNLQFFVLKILFQNAELFC